MKAAYVDNSCLVAIVVGERGSTAIARRLWELDLLISSGLLEAELRAALVREDLPTDAMASRIGPKRSGRRRCKLRGRRPMPPREP